MKLKELKTLPKMELNKKIEELQRELIKDNAQVAIGVVPKSPGKLKAAKKMVAKIKTILKNKEVRVKE